MDALVTELDRIRCEPLNGDKQERDHSMFPIEVLPRVIQNYVQAKSRSLPAPPEAIAIPMMVAAGAAIGTSRAIQLKPGWDEFGAIYAAIVMSSGSLKTPSLRAAVAPVDSRQHVLKEEYDAACRTYKQELVDYERQLRMFYRNGGPGPAPIEPVRPIQKRTWVSDTTVERLAVLLDENPRGLLAVRDELTAWVKGLNQYKGGRGADLPFYLSMWSQQSVTIDRQNKPPLILKRPFLSIVGCIPPDMLRQLKVDECEDGHLPRILFSCPDPVPTTWTDEEVPASYINAVDTLFTELYGLTDEQVLPLTPDAKELFVSWHEQHGAETESGCIDAPLVPFYSKMRGYCARLALIHAITSDSRSSVITAESIAAAASLIDYFKAQLQRALPHFTKERLSKIGRTEQAIIRHLSNEWLANRGLQQKVGGEAGIYNRAIENLLKAGSIEERKQPKGYRLLLNPEKERVSL